MRYAYMDMTETKANEYQSYLFHEGTNFASYKYLGAHEEADGSGGYNCVFRVWAPNALRVVLVSDRTCWEPENASGDAVMHRVTENGVWETTLHDTSSFTGMYYKFAVTGADGETYLKSDPYAFRSETLGKSASIVCEYEYDGWTDKGWLRYRDNVMAKSAKAKHFYPAPLNVYEVHLPSWKTVNGLSTEAGDNYISYRDAAEQLVPYIKKMGYTHIELLPITEYPFDGSWGYQVCSYFAPTARFGEPRDFAYFVNKMHENGIGVILDWVPAHFPKDRPGLYEFDGQPLYEYQGETRMENKGWGTRCFDVGRNEVQSFLISSAMFWFREYHIDGLRVDAVSSMLYLDYDRKDGEWLPNSVGTNHNLESIAFFRKLNSTVFAEFPSVLMIAEESTAWPLITKPAHDGGLGFNFKWNMGWANDMFEYVSTDPLFRKYHHSKLTFPLMYAFSENYILPVSHDEVVHGKRSLIDKMFGEYDDKFSGMRAFLVNMMTIPGKKLMFMGCEFAQFREWDFANQLEWFMTDYPRHAEMQRFVAELNNLYLSSPQLWEIDDSWDGFEWINADDGDNNVVSYIRRDVRGRRLVVVVNYSPVKRENYKLCLPLGTYTEILNTDLYCYGGRNIQNEGKLSTVRQKGDTDRKNGILSLTLPPLSGLILKKEVRKKKQTGDQ